MIRSALLILLSALTLASCSLGSQPSSTPAESPLAAGTYTSVVFQPAVTFTVPDGWVLATDSAGYLQLRPADQNVLGIHLFRGASAASQDASCPLASAEGVGGSSIALVDWIRGLDGLNVSSPAMVTIGGLRGSSIDLSIKVGWTQSCSFANGAPTVPLLVEAGIGLRWVLAGGERLRLYLLDIPGGDTLLIDIDDFEGSQFDTFLRTAIPVVTSMTFAS